MLSLGSCGIRLLPGAFDTAQKFTDWDLEKPLKNCFRVSKRLPTICADNVQANDLYELREGRGTDYLFPQKFCWSRWL